MDAIKGDPGDVREDVVAEVVSIPKMGIGYRQVRVSIAREVRIQIVPAVADIIVKEIDRDCASLRCGDSSSGSSSSASHPFPALVSRSEAKASVILFLCFHGGLKNSRA